MFMENRQQLMYNSELLDTMLIGLFIKLVRLHSDSCEFPPSVKKSDLVPFKLMQYLQDNYLDITLSDVAEKFNFTPEYTSKLIKNTTGYNFTQIIKKIRMQHAEKLLLDTNISISDICLSVGYFNPEHFIRTFKQIYKITPSEYRKQHSKNKIQS